MEVDVQGHVAMPTHPRVKPAPPKQPDSLEELIEQLYVVFEDDHVNVEYVQELMTLYKSNYRDWKKFAKFDKHRYTRNLVDRGNDKFNLMLLCWNEGQGSSIHNHSNAHCFMKILEGSANEELFPWPNESSEEERTEMRPLRTNTYTRNQVAYINDDIGLHRVENPSHTDKLVTLHLYSPPFDSCRVFDQHTAHSSTARVTFWSEFGKRTGPAATRNTEDAENN